MSAALSPATISPVLTAANGLQYLVFVPPSWSPPTPTSPKHPLLLFLHGAGGVNSPENVQGQSLMRMLADKDFAATKSHIVVAPIAPERPWQPSIPSIMDLLSALSTDLGGDPKKTSLAGQSMGGNGAWSIASDHAATFASITPVCGYIEGDRAGNGVPTDYPLANLARTPIWVFHAEDDSVVPVQASDVVVAALQAKGGTAAVKYTRYEPGLAPPCKTKVKDLPGHASYELAFKDEEWWTWLESQSLE